MSSMGVRHIREALQRLVVELQALEAEDGRIEGQMTVDDFTRPVDVDDDPTTIPPEER